MAPRHKLKNVALKKSEKLAIDGRVIVNEILSDIIEHVLLRADVIDLLCLEDADFELEMVISKHAQTKTIYAEKFRGIVTEFFGDVAVGTIGDVAVGTIGDVAVGTIEEPPEPFFDIGDSVVYTGLTQRFNGSQVTTGMHGHVVNEVEKEGFVKVEFDRVGRAVLAKRNLVLDGGDKLLSSAKESHWLLRESHGLTSTSVAQHRVSIQRRCPGCHNLFNDDKNRVCTQCNAMADKFHADVEITRDLHAGYVNMKFTLKEFKEGKFIERAKMRNIDELIAERKLTHQYKKAIMKRNGVKAPVYQAARQTQNTRGSEASSSHQCPQDNSARNNAAGSADMDTNWREQYQREVYSQTLQYQPQQHEVAQYFWNLSMNELTASSTGQEEGRGPGRREEEEWLAYQSQATDFRNTETQEVPQPRENQPESNDCVICCDETSTHAMIPCGHHCVCQACATALAGGICPICRGEIKGVMHIFRS